jgi:NAD+ kinase
MIFQKIAIFGKLNGHHSWDLIKKLITHFQPEGKTFYLDEVSCHDFPAEEFGVEILPRPILVKKAEMAVVIGGDGSFLNAARSVVDAEIPILGINLGRIGFLTDVSPENMLPTLEDIFKGIYDCEERNLLNIAIEKNGEAVFRDIAFNDVVIHKHDSPRMIEFESFIDGRFFNHHRSDGLIISTPTGSTAYALSAGGPILMPEIDAISLVSINPHTISNRPVVISGKSVITLHPYENCRGEAQVICDGQVVYQTDHNHVTRIIRHPKFIKMLHPKGHDHFQILRAKLNWGTQP